MRGDFVTLAGCRGTPTLNSYENGPLDLHLERADVLMNLLLAALGPKPEPAHPEMLSTTLVGGAGMQGARRAVERPVNVKI